MRAVIIAFVLAGTVIAGATTDASAKVKKHVVKPQAAASIDTVGLNSIPLTVNRRSWLDSGNTVRSDSNNGGRAYIADQTQFNQTEDRIIDPDKFGNDVIRGQPTVPGQSVPVVDFDTEPNGRPHIDDVLGAQNYYFNPAPPQVPSLPAAIPFFPDR